MTSQTLGVQEGMWLGCGILGRRVVSVQFAVFCV